jgi:hypothetical protein
VSSQASAPGVAAILLRVDDLDDMLEDLDPEFEGSLGVALPSAVTV